MTYVVGIVLAAIWLYVLSVLNRSKLLAWHFVVGALGLFLLLMFFVQPVATEPLARAVAAVAGVFGSITHTFEAYFLYGVVFIDSISGPMTLQIDFECSGIIEIIVFISLIAFFRVYTVNERIVLGVVGTIFIMLSNVLRIITISEIIYFFGPESYYVAHSLVGRLVFYALTVLLYFYVFTKPQIVRMKVGSFTYADRKEIEDSADAPGDATPQMPTLNEVADGTSE